LPITLQRSDGKLKLTRSGGGLATGLDSLDKEFHWLWLGWPGLDITDPEEQAAADELLRERSLYPVYLSPEQRQDYYEGYCNSILWPLCHYFFSYIEYSGHYWQSYREVNEIFCREALKLIEPGDFVWVHDYHLMLLPDLLRRQAPDIGIGYFHHIPFPSYELFRYLPERAELLRGILGADLVGFHIHDYMRHFISAVYRVLHVNCHLDEVSLPDRVVRLEAFPMGINYELYKAGPHESEAVVFAEEIRRLAGNRKIILSVDRLDYSKGIPMRLKAYGDFLDNNPEYRDKVTLIMVLAPSRDTVDSYAALKEKIDKLIGAINGAHAVVGWTPVHYFYRAFSFTELSALYHTADIALITPMRDGMNLVAKEFLAARDTRPGVLILSEMAGASIELAEAIIVNPMDARQIEDALLAALNMSEEDQRASLENMQRDLIRHDVRDWTHTYFMELCKAKERNERFREKVLDAGKAEQIGRQYREAARRLIVLDYDGTLVPLVKKYAMAKPGRELMQLLNVLAGDPRNRVVICSGRDQATLEQWLGGLDIDLVAEHGAFFREKGIWQAALPPFQMDEEVTAILERMIEKTPRSMLERKKTSLVWHYRNVDPWLAELRVSQLVTALMAPCARSSLMLMHGRRVVEVRQTGCNKGQAVIRLRGGAAYDFYLAMGDDVTDVDMFAALPQEALTINIGRCADAARFFLPEQHMAPAFLRSLSSTS
jgi:trehalose 6-phosphate synthase/phosphatase